jgi:hypothetical protein
MKQVLVIIMNILLVVPLFAQDTTRLKPATGKIVIKVEERTEKMSEGYNHCLSVFIQNAQKKDVDRNFAKYMKGFNAKADQNKGEYFFDNATIKQFGNDPVDVYSITVQKDQGVLMQVFMDLGGAYLNSEDHTPKFDVAKRMIYDFAKQEAKNAVQFQIVESQKILQKKLREQNELVRQDSLLFKKIRSAEQLIRQSEETIKLNEEKQAVKQKEIIEHQKMMDKLKERQAEIE